MAVKPYNPESYWDQVAHEIGSRRELKLIAGDDEPYYRYKRAKFLQLLNRLDVTGKTVLEVGSGPGGNLDVLSRKGAGALYGADVSQRMIALSRRLLQGRGVEIRKTNGTSLPFEDRFFDLVFTSTVLQHNTHEESLRGLITEICRVSRSEVVIFERIEPVVKGHDSNLGRPVSYYAALFREQGFELRETRFLHIQASYVVCGLIRKLFNPRSRREGESLTSFSLWLQRVLLPLTRILDRWVPGKRDLGMLHFTRPAS